MNTDTKPFSAKKAFGLSVLLKLTRTRCKGIKIMSNGTRLMANVPFSKISDAVAETIKRHHIVLKIK